MSSAYAALADRHREIALLHSCSSTLGWDQETHLPPSALTYRADQLSYLSGKAYALSSGKDYHNLLTAAEDSQPTSILEKANLREWRYQYQRATCLNQSIVERESQITSHAKAAWIKAREDNNFSHFAPHMQQLLDLAKEKAELWGYENEAYDALLANFERGATTKDVESIFSRYEPQIKDLAASAVNRSTQASPRQFEGSFPVEAQKQLNREVAESLGFDFSSGRIDTTTHPFCTTLGPKDVRLTTRYYDHDFTASLFGVMHEAGHGLYEQGLPDSEYGLPSGSSVSLGIHESQSLLWEAHVGRSPEFWHHWFPRAQELFPQLNDWNTQEFLQRINQATFSPIRVDADEATYDLHILLRFNIERQLLKGELQVQDIPAAWNELFASYFGFTPENDTQGCLQDIHWSMGGLGYFATYTLGNLNASQLFHIAIQSDAIKNAYDNANFTPLLEWMRTHIHQKASLELPQDLMASATGQTTNPDFHIQHLNKRFLNT
ncbi:carboxypeptidase M32 [Rubritalea tangerina]|uniref:Metal-dependent carboxypeptidase n=1 Tax=Rubritalea tangerina TaxID=430798 RepID=A0ABW4ZG56_9BACT